MGTITSGVGLISGINSGSIIDQLIALDAQPAKNLQTRIDNNNKIKTAYATIQAGLTGLLSSANLLIRPSTFQAASALSSDTNILGATASATAPAGIYSFIVARTVTNQSLITGGFADATTALVGAGSIKIGLGGGEVTSSVNLSDLNGGAGVRRGTFRLTDRSGNSATIDIGNAVNLDDVIKKINTADNIQVKASLTADGLVLQDLSGGTGDLKVADLQGGNAAADLGIKQSVSADTLTGSAIHKIGRSSTLSSLNDGLGVRTKAGVDFQVVTADGTTKTIDFNTPKTVGDILDAINTAGAGKFTASIRTDGKGLQIVDNTTGSGTLTTTALAGSSALKDLGLDGTASGSTLTGTGLVANLGSVLTKTLNGGKGLGNGTVSLTDRNGTVVSVNVAADSSFDDVIQSINSAGSTLRASLNQAGTGIQLTDTSTGTGNVVIADSAGTAAASLGLAGTFDTTHTTIDGGSAKRQFVGEKTPLSDLNGGRGITTGKFKITNAAGDTETVDLTTLTNGTLGDVIDMINAKNMNVTASVNSDGSGLLLTDNSTGGGKLTVSDTNGSAGRDLNILGTATGNTLDGSYGATISVTATDTLTTVLAKINNSKGGVTASIINDGSGANPYRLTLTANNSGRDGRFTFDAGSTGLGADNLVRAQDAAVFFGGAGTSGGNNVLITSSSNSISNVVPGVTLNLNGVSDKAVTVSVSQTSDNAVSQIQSFVKSFNSLTSNIGQLTSFDPTTTQRGILLGDSATSGVNDALFAAINQPIKNAGRYSLFSQIGLTVGADNQLSFDTAKFTAAYQTDPTSVQRIFTAFNTVSTTTKTQNGVTTTTDTVTTPFGTDPSGVSTTNDSSGAVLTTTTKLVGFGLGYAIQSAINKITDPVNGTLTLSSNSLDSANDIYTQRIASINDLLTSKKARLQAQFANMESVLATLQSQQSSISKIASLTTTGG